MPHEPIDGWQCVYSRNHRVTIPVAIETEDGLFESCTPKCACFTCSTLVIAPPTGSLPVRKQWWPRSKRPRKPICRHKRGSAPKSGPRPLDQCTKPACVRSCMAAWPHGGGWPRARRHPCARGPPAVADCRGLVCQGRACTAQGPPTHDTGPLQQTPDMCARCLHRAASARGAGSALLHPAPQRARARQHAVDRAAATKCAKAVMKRPHSPRCRCITRTSSRNATVHGA